MAKIDPDQIAEQQLRARLLRALATPPISNNDILKRSKAVDKKNRQ